MEYQALESRVQNDARVGYTVVAAMIAASFALMSAWLATFGDKILADEFDLPEFLITFLLASASVVLLQTAISIQERFADAGKVRVARAVQIEEELKIYSFRLFPPWCEHPDDYMSYLRKWMSRGVKEEESPTEEDAKTLLKRFGDKKRVSRSFRVLGYFSIGVWVVLTILSGLFAFNALV